MYKVRSTKGYRKALKRISRHKDFSGTILKEVVRTLAQGETLAPNRKDHQLTGEFKEYRECHLQYDLLLMYQIHEDILVLLLVDLGTHDDLFR
jgi:mRNA interferase YafQ